MPATVIRLAPRDRAPRPRPPLMTAEERDRALHAELRQARIRIARLEAALAHSAAEAREQRERAHAAERLLATLAEEPRPAG